MANKVATKVSSVQAELEKELSTKRKVAEGGAAYSARLVTLIQEADDSVWESLSGHTQKWVNEASAAVDSKKAIPSFPDDEDTDEAPVKGKGKAVDKKAAGKGGKAAVPAKGKATTSKEDKSEKGPSMRRYIKQCIVATPGISIEDLNKLISKAGYEPTKATVMSIRSDTRDTMKVLQDAGKGKFDFSLV